MVYCKTMFFLVYVIPMLLVFLLFNVLVLPLAWLKGFLTLNSLLLKDRPLSNLGLWTFLGVFVLLYVIMKDLSCIL